MPENETAEELSAKVERWLADFETTLVSKDASQLERLFTPEAGWRDLVSFTWDMRQAYDRDAIGELAFSVVDDIQPRNFRLAASRPAPQRTDYPGLDYVELFFDFDTAFGWGTGFVRLNDDESQPSGLRAWSLFTELSELNGYHANPPHIREHALGTHGKGGDGNWLEQLTEQHALVGRDPDVLIVGGGHSGVMLAAHLKRLGVEALVIDKNERIGDNWRKRYRSLVLHNPTEMNHFPYIRYPDSWPEFLPKDKLANWIETYVDLLELNFWTSTEFLGGAYDDATGTWTASIRKSDGTERVMHPQHVVIATGGAGGKPKIPDLKGIASFKGDVMHSSQFSGGAAYAGKKALVVGTGTSAHDIALDFYKNGATVSMLQRNPTTVVQVDTANLAYASYFTGARYEDCDMTAAAEFIYPKLLDNLRAYTAMTQEIDKELLDGLEAAGMRLDVGEDGTGWVMKFLRYGGGYYLNVGASDVIIAGGISIIQSDDVAEFVADGATMKDGSVAEFDVIVLATGYHNQQTETEKYFGAEVSELVGPISGFAPEGGELLNVWKATPQPGLWFMVGGINQARVGSPGMAFQIKGYLADLIPESLRVHPKSAGVLEDAPA
ncbi:MAG: hypothetical protein JWP10_1583 [Nocardioidaceae bacterium]|nr:hypothetical protein [Nocardioidaceae bacterium]